jgi:glycerol uptake facilitator-like aquaporin
MAVAPAAAGYVYVAYTSLQFMTEPGMYSMLMSRVDEGHRSGASAMNFFVAFSCHALAAAVAGQVIAKGGYSPALIAAACLALDIDRGTTTGGFWTPATAFGERLIHRLQAHAGLRFEVLDDAA